MSPFVEVTSAGPYQHASAGAITFLVFPERGGPTMIAAQSAGERNTPPLVRPAHTCVPAIDPARRATHESSDAPAATGAPTPVGLRCSLSSPISHRAPATQPAKLTSANNTLAALMASAEGWASATPAAAAGSTDTEDSADTAGTARVAGTGAVRGHRAAQDISVLAV